jgi:hypothetical protein
MTPETETVRYWIWKLGGRHHYLAENSVTARKIAKARRVGAELISDSATSLEAVEAIVAAWRCRGVSRRLRLLL